MVLEQLGMSTVNALVTLFQGFLEVMPGLIAAVILLLVGYLVAYLIYKIIDTVLEKIDFDKHVIKTTGLHKSIGELKLGHLLAVVSKWYVFVVFLAPAASLVELNNLSNLLIKLSVWIPNLIAAFLVIVLGILIADYASVKIQHLKLSYSKSVAHLARLVILIFAGLVALDHLGFTANIAEKTLLVIVAGVMLGFGLAVGIGYGLALKDYAKKTLNKLKNLF